MKLYGGIDLHSNNSVIALSDEEDRVVFRRREANDLERVLQLSTSSLSTADRRIVRTDAMDRRIKKAASSRAPSLEI